MQKIRSTMRSSIFLCLMPLFLAEPLHAQFGGGGLLPTSPAPESAGPSVIVKVDVTASASGRGLMIRGVDGCVIITAAHVVGDSADVVWSDQEFSARYWQAKLGPSYPASDVDVTILTLPDHQSVNNCPALPRPAAVNTAIAKAEFATIVLSETGKTSDKIAGRILGTSGDSVAIQVDSIAGPGISGAPVFIGDIPVGIVIGGPAPSGSTICSSQFPRQSAQAGITELCIRRLDYISTALASQIFQTIDDQLTGISGESANGETLSWQASLLALTGRSKSARQKYKEAGQAGSAAGWIGYAEALKKGDGGPVDATGASGLEVQFATKLIEQASVSNAALFELADRYYAGRISSADLARVRQRLFEGATRLKLQVQHGDPTAAAYQIFLIFKEYSSTRKSFTSPEILRQLGIRPGYSNPDSIFSESCQTRICHRELVRNVYNSSLRAMNRGSEFGAILLLLFSDVSNNMAGSYTIPDCQIFADIEFKSLVRRTALAACTLARRRIALRSMAPEALDNGGDIDIWRDALKEGVPLFDDESRMQELAGWSDQASLDSALFSFRDRELDGEMSVLAAVAELRQNQRLDPIASALKTYISRNPVINVSRNADRSLSVALGVLAVIQTQGDARSPADSIGLADTMRKINELSPGQIAEVALVFEAAANFWRVKDEELPPLLKAKHIELLKLAASNGSTTAIYLLLGTELKAIDFRLAVAAKLHPYLRKALEAREPDVDGVVELLCKAEAKSKVRDGQHRNAVKFCRNAFDDGHFSIATDLAEIYLADGNLADREAVLAKGVEMGVKDAVETKLRDAYKVKDFLTVEKLLKILIANGDTSYIQEYLVDTFKGDITWNDFVITYLVRVFVRWGGYFECQQEVLNGSGCVLASPRYLLGRYRTKNEPNLPEISEARYKLIRDALRASGRNIQWFVPTKPASK